MVLIIYMPTKDEHLEEISSKERIQLVRNDSIRRWGQIVISFILIGAMIGYLGYFTVVLADAEFQKEIAQDMRVLLIMGIGASLAIFGLGRTVGRSKS